MINPKSASLFLGHPVGIDLFLLKFLNEILIEQDSRQIYYSQDWSDAPQLFPPPPFS